MNLNDIRNLQDVVKYNAMYTEKEGRRPSVRPTWPSR
ncbi:hypothetical protein ACJ72_05270 [Emergomyces africanus]|uniref:Uncharacterized protein n=1 Tax=Emergomyces africanus TaxID=1955775 RepID=A0A1B7NUJ2_9EURO|nr:hypothetical protein ACJ72_05270 [Emergomyces africanus]